MGRDHKKNDPSPLILSIYYILRYDNLNEMEVINMRNPDPTRSWLIRLIDFLTRGKESPYEKIDRKIKKGKK